MNLRAENLLLKENLKHSQQAVCGYSREIYFLHLYKTFKHFLLPWFAAVI